MGVPASVVQIQKLNSHWIKKLTKLEVKKIKRKRGKKYEK